MNKRTVVLVIAVALVSGYFGSYWQHRIWLANNSQPFIQNVRATKIELVSSSGKTLAVMSEDATKGKVSLTFFDERGRPRTSIGTEATHRSKDALWVNYSPFLTLAGTDGDDRFNVGLNEFDKPVLVMGGPDWHSRILLGHDVLNDPDVGPRTDMDGWMLAFFTPGHKGETWIGTARSNAYMILSSEGKHFVVTPSGTENK